MRTRSSGYKIPYDVRPSKQAERYIMVELLHKLDPYINGISGYHYVGMGSLFFHDFRVFHQLLGIKKLTSIEVDESLSVRCGYNKPYEGITLVMDLSTNFLASTSIDDNYLLWMDYDFGFGSVAYNDIITTFSRFRSGTIIFATLDFERPDDKPGQILDELKDQLPAGITDGLLPSDLTARLWKRTMIQLIEKTITQGIYGRRDVTFLRLFSFEYRDTSDMYTLGGIIINHPQRRKVVRAVKSWPFFCRDRLDRTTKIPQFVMTKKERGYLDCKAHSTNEYVDEVGISREEFNDYRRFYRYLPIYSEVI